MSIALAGLTVSICPLILGEGEDCWEAIVHLVNSGGKIVHMDHFMFYGSVYASLLTLFGAITILIPGCDR